MAQSRATDTMHPAGKLPPTLTPTGHFAGKPTLPISRSVTLIGSRKHARLQLISSTVSQNHAIIVNADSGPYVRDLASREHVLVNGIEVKEGPLEDGDEISIGRFSFRFNASPHTQPSDAVRRIRPAPLGKLEVDGSDLPVPFDGKSMVIGRRDGCDVKLLEDSVSTTHAIIFEMDGRRFIRDLASRSGTFVNGKQIHQAELSPGDEIRCGQTEMRYVADGGPAAEAFAPPAAAAGLGAVADDLVEADAQQSAIPVEAADDVEFEPLEALEPAEPVEPAAPAAGVSLSKRQPPAEPGEPAAPPAESAATEAPIPVEADADADADAEADALELVQDRAEDVEPVDINAPGSEVERIEGLEGLEALEPAQDALETVEPSDLEVEVDEAPAAAASSAPPAAPAPDAESDLDLHVEPLSEDDLMAELEAMAPPTAAAPRDPAAPGPSLNATQEDIELAGLAPATPPAPAAPRGPRPPAAPAPSMGATQEDMALDGLTPLAPYEPAAPAPAAPSMGATQEDIELGFQAEFNEAAPGDFETGGRSRAAEAEADEPAEIEFRDEPAEMEIAQDALTASADRADEDAGEAQRSSDALAPLAELEPPSLDAIERAGEAEAPADGAAPAPAAESTEAAEAAAELEEIDLGMEVEDLADAPPAPPPAAPPAPVQRRMVSDEIPEFEPPAPGEPIDFTADAEAEADALVQDALEPLGDSPAAAEAAPLALEDEAAGATEGAEPLPDFDDAAALAALELPVDAAPPALDATAGAGTGAIAETPTLDVTKDVAPEAAPKKKKPRKSRKKKAEEALAMPEPVADAPLTADDLASGEPIELDMPVAPDGPAAAPPPSRVAPPGASQLDLTPIADAELIAPTEATPESALDLDDAVAAGEAAAADRLHEVDLTDSTFGRAVEDFTGHSTGAIVEAPAGEAEPELRPQSSSEPVMLEAIEAVELAQDDSMPSAAAGEADTGTAREDVADAVGAAAVEEAAAAEAQEPAADDATVAARDEAVALDAIADADVAVTADDAPVQTEDVAEDAGGPEAVEIAEAVEPLEIEETPSVDDEPAVVAAAAAAEPAPAAPRDAVEPPSIDDEAALDLLTSEPGGGARDSMGLTLDEDRALRAPEPAPEPLLPGAAGAAAGAAASSELRAPEAGTDAGAGAGADSSDDRLFDLEPLPAEGAKALDPRYSVHPEDLEDSESLAGAGAAGMEVEEADLDLDTIETVDGSASSAGGASALEPLDVLGDAEVEAVDPAAARDERDERDEPRGDRSLESLEAAAAAAAAAAESDEADVELEPIAEAPAAEPVAKAGPAEPDQPPASQQATPPQQPPPAPAPQQPRRPAAVEVFNWGANQEHFFGGQPLNLGGPRPQPPQQRPPAQAPPPQQQRPAAQQPPLQPAPSQQRPAPRQQPPSSFPQRAAPQQQPQRPAAQRPSPFAGGNVGSESRLASGFEGLAIPPVGENDVFGQVPGSLTAGFDPALMNDVFGGGIVGGAGAKNNNNAAATGRRAMPTPQPGGSASSNNAGGAGDATAPAAQRRQPPPPPRRATKAEPTGDAWTSAGPLGGDIDQTDPLPAQQPGRRGGAGGAGAGLPPQPMPAGDEDASQPPPPPAKKKRRWFGLRVLVPFALLSMAAAGAAVYRFVPVKSSVTGTLKFENFAKLPALNRREFVKPQLALLNDENRTLREAARRKLEAINKTHAAGFLGDPMAYAKVVSLNEFDVENGTLSLPYVGGASRADQDRMLALLQALYDRNRPLVDEANELTLTVERLTRERAELEKSRNELAARIEELGVAAQRMPDIGERGKIEAEAKRLESAWKAAVANVTRLTTELKQLRDNPPAQPAPPAAATEPVPADGNAAAQNANADAAGSDALLAQLQSELAQVRQRLAAVQEARGTTAQAARQKLDEAVAALDQQITQAQVRDNPALLAYLTKAQETLKQAAEVTDQHAARQQAQFAELSRVKQQHGEKLAARRAEVWKKDPELVNLMDQRDFKTRQLNTAVGQGLTKEAADLRDELSTLQTAIAARQTLVADDGAYADAIDQLEKIADSTQKDIEADRAATLQKLEEMQQDLSRARPAAETIPPEQRALADEVEKRLAAVAAARQQFVASTGEANPSGDDELRALEASASELAAKVEVRKQQLAQAGGAGTTAAAAGENVQLAAAPASESPAPAAAPAAAAADPQAAVAQKERELAAAEKTRADAEAAYFAANKRLHAIKQQIEDARAAGEKRDALVRQRDLAEANLRQLDNQYDLKKKLAEQKTFPAVPNESNLKVVDKGDPRPMYTLIACGGIAALCVCLGLLSAAGGGGGGGSDDAEPSDLPPMYPGQRHEQEATAEVPFADEAHDRQRPTPVEV